MKKHISNKTFMAILSMHFSKSPQQIKKVLLQWGEIYPYKDVPELPENKREFWSEANLGKAFEYLQKLYAPWNRPPLPMVGKITLKRLSYIIYNKALRNGDLVRQKCIDCGFKFTDGHHADYGEPLKVYWYCKNHHMAEHRRLRKLYKNKPIIF